MASWHSGTASATLSLAGRGRKTRNTVFPGVADGAWAACLAEGRPRVSREAPFPRVLQLSLCRCVTPRGTFARHAFRGSASERARGSRANYRKSDFFVPPIAADSCTACRVKVRSSYAKTGLAREFFFFRPWKTAPIELQSTWPRHESDRFGEVSKSELRDCVTDPLVLFCLIRWERERHSDRSCMGNLSRLGIQCLDEQLSPGPLLRRSHRCPSSKTLFVSAPLHLSSSFLVKYLSTGPSQCLPAGPFSLNSPLTGGIKISSNFLQKYPN